MITISAIRIRDIIGGTIVTIVTTGGRHTVVDHRIRAADRVIPAGGLGILMVGLGIRVAERDDLALREASYRSHAKVNTGRGVE